MFRRCARFLAAEGDNPEVLTRAASAWNLDFGDKFWTHEMNFNNKHKAIPCYRVLDLHGNPENDIPESLTQPKARKMLTYMIKQNAADKILLDAQRTGVLSFYMTGFGEEAAVVGSAAAVDDQDCMFMQYREAGALHYRGMTISEMIAQCMGNVEDPAKGRQMPIHYGSVRLNVQTVSSPLSTQIPQAAGAGYAYKLDKKGKIVICYFGEGAASEGDCAAGLNFAATTGAHTLFICRNNGFAISTPARDQYRGDGIVARGIAFGMPSIRVDGTDAVAVYAATEKARKMIVEHDTPVLIETMGYRVGHHSTSDDSTRYRSKDEIKYFDNELNPITRFEAFLTKKGWWAAEETSKIVAETRALVISELERQKKVPVYGPEYLFQDTFKEPIPTLAEQRDDLLAHVERYKAVYDAERQAKSVH
jgi:2-oxoisovalerate dehydrogenase E1 component alpha subunit